MAVGDAFLSAFLQVLFDRLASPELLKIAQIWRVDVELKKLKGTLLKIQAVLNDAELKQVWNNAVRIWLEDLKHLAYDVEDIVDEFEIEALRWKLEAEPQFDPTQVWPLIPFRRKDLGLKEKTERNTYGISQRPATSSLVNKSRIVGREADKQKLVDLLLSNDTSEGEVCRNGDKVFIIPVSGMGGIGKTTIAQLVYNEERVIQQFELKAWVCVSEEFDLMRVTRSILESATGRSSDLKDLGQLQVSLKKVLRGKRFLIVLDNVWNENYNNWDDLMVPLRAGAQGSKVIVTTRSEAVSLMVGSIPSYNLDGLTYEDSIGKEIVKKCGRLPLVAKALGGLLRNKVLDSELSYYHLPAHLKPCFAYCSIFPKGYELDKENLVLLWMAEGFVQQKQKKQIEDIGREYFDELFSRSFFQKSCSNASSFVMHDLINDLARNISGDISFRLNDASDIKSLCRISEKQRYFACSLPHKVQSNLFPVLKCLRVLSLRWYNMTEFPDSISNLKHLRYLDLSHTNIVRLPESMSTLYSLQSLMLIDCYHLTGLVDNMGNLIHLRHLDTRGSFKLQKMPVGIDNLTSLQTLSSFVVGENGSSRIRDLRDMSNLRGKLCILKLENVADIIDVVEANIKNKEHLHELELIGCTKCESLPSLGLLPSLRNLVIDGMHGLEEWSSGVEESGVREFPCLHELTIWNCPNLRRFSLPRLPLLCELDLEECDGTILRSVVDLMSLTSLHISGISNLVCLPEGMFKNLASLEELKIGLCNLRNLEDLRIVNVPKVESLPEGLHDLTSLESLIIEGCPSLTSLAEMGLPACHRLKSLPEEGLPHFLSRLVIRNCPLLKRQCQMEIGRHWHKIAHISYIEIDNRMAREISKDEEGGDEKIISG
ncbi:unnamed protein product, partial [Vitis vinifera]|uniref:Disease resistance RPP13-like protein 1 n=1 Tax=Vitis vinifera TaxID=29760 RepID=D7SNF3_VITVI